MLIGTTDHEIHQMADPDTGHLAELDWAGTGELDSQRTAP